MFQNYICCCSPCWIHCLFVSACVLLHWIRAFSLLHMWLIFRSSFSNSATSSDMTSLTTTTFHICFKNWINESPTFMAFPLLLLLLLLLLLFEIYLLHHSFITCLYFLPPNIRFYLALIMPSFAFHNWSSSFHLVHNLTSKFFWMRRKGSVSDMM